MAFLGCCSGRAKPDATLLDFIASSWVSFRPDSFPSVPRSLASLEKHGSKLEPVVAKLVFCRLGSRGGVSCAYGSMADGSSRLLMVPNTLEFFLDSSGPLLRVSVMLACVGRVHERSSLSCSGRRIELPDSCLKSVCLSTC